MRQLSFHSRLLLPVLIGFCASIAQGAPPQIIEVHKDPSISDADRLEDFQTYQMNSFTPDFKKTCTRDTTYWVVSKRIYPSISSAFQGVPEKLLIKPSTKENYRKTGIGVTGSAVLPKELLPYYKNRFILVSEPIDNFTKPELKILNLRYGERQIQISGDLTSCSISDTNDVIDSSLQANKSRAVQLGKEAHSVLSKISDNPFYFNPEGYSLILGACRDDLFLKKNAAAINANFYIFRIVK